MEMERRDITSEKVFKERSILGLEKLQKLNKIQDNLTKKYTELLEKTISKNQTVIKANVGLIDPTKYIC